MGKWLGHLSEEVCDRAGTGPSSVPLSFRLRISNEGDGRSRIMLLKCEKDLIWSGPCPRPSLTIFTQVGLGSCLLSQRLQDLRPLALN